MSIHTVAGKLHEEFRLLKDKELYSVLSTKSSKNVEEFDWDETALKTIEVYKETVSNKGKRYDG